MIVGAHAHLRAERGLDTLKMVMPTTTLERMRSGFKSPHDASCVNNKREQPIPDHLLPATRMTARFFVHPCGTLLRAVPVCMAARADPLRRRVITRRSATSQRARIIHRYGNRTDRHGVATPVSVKISAPRGGDAALKPPLIKLIRRAKVLRRLYGRQARCQGCRKRPAGEAGEATRGYWERPREAQSGETTATVEAEFPAGEAA